MTMRLKRTIRIHANRAESRHGQAARRRRAETGATGRSAVVAQVNRLKADSWTQLQAMRKRLEEEKTEWCAAAPRRRVL